MHAARAAVAVQENVSDPTSRVLVRQLQRLGAEPLRTHDRHQAVGQDAADRGIGQKVFELRHGARVDRETVSYRTTGGSVTRVSTESTPPVRGWRTQPEARAGERLWSRLTTDGR